MSLYLPNGIMCTLHIQGLWTRAEFIKGPDTLRELYTMIWVSQDLHVYVWVCARLHEQRS